MPSALFAPPSTMPPVAWPRREIGIALFVGAGLVVFGGLAETVRVGSMMQRLDLQELTAQIVMLTVVASLGPSWATLVLP